MAIISEVIKELQKVAPNAIFTKTEALEMCQLVFEKEVEEYEIDKEYLEIKFKIEDFDQDCPYDDLLDNVSFLGWENIDCVLCFKKAEIESNF